MNFSEKTKEMPKEISNIMASELRKLDISVGNIELHPVAVIILESIGTALYRMGIEDASKVFAKCSERFEEDLYILERDSRSKS